MRLPQKISDDAARRRTLLFDALIAIAMAIVVIALSAGLGIVGSLALITLLVLALSRGIEAALGLARRRRSGGARRRSAAGAER